MKNKYFKIITLCIICALFIVVKSCKSPDILPDDSKYEQSQQPLTRSGDLAWDYPVKPGMESWNSLKTEEERIAILQIPESILATLTPEEVVGLCITFPDFGHFTAWNTPQESFNVMLSRYNILRHLLSREGVGKSLIEAYKDTNLTGFKTLPYSNEYWSLKLLYLELLLSQKEILQSLMPEEKLELVKEAAAKIIAKLSNEAFSGQPDILFPFRIMVNILDIERYPEFMEFANKETVRQFINTGWVFEDVLPLQEIINAINNYVYANQIIIDLNN